MKRITVTSSLDGSAEPSLLYVPRGQKKIPLVVGLHSWSFNLDNQVASMLPYAKKLRWALLLPEFRGNNLPRNPRGRQACASELAKQDIVDAVDRVTVDHAEVIDRERIFLLGGSGGGHMALAMAGYRPDLWRMVSAWCPITDLVAWHGQNPGYVPGIEACCGGKPHEVPAEYQQRSPLSHIETISRATVFIYHGKWDKSVPFTHSLNLYQSVIAFKPDAKVYLSIFDGGHELLYAEAFASFVKALNAAEASRITG